MSVPIKIQLQCTKAVLPNPIIRKSIPIQPYELFLHDKEYPACSKVLMDIGLV